MMETIIKIIAMIVLSTVGSPAFGQKIDPKTRGWWCGTSTVDLMEDSRSLLASNPTSSEDGEYLTFGVHCKKMPRVQSVAPAPPARSMIHPKSRTLCESSDCGIFLCIRPDYRHAMELMTRAATNG